MNTLQNTVWLKVAYIHSINQLDDKSIRALVNKTKSDSLLTAKLRYRLNPEFTVLTGTLYVELYPISPKIQKLVNCEDPLKTPIFKVNVSASASLPQVGEDIEDNAKLWAERHGTYLRSSLENICREILIRLEQTLKNPNHLPEED